MAGKSPISEQISPLNACVFGVSGDFATDISLQMAAGATGRRMEQQGIPGRLLKDTHV